MVREATKPARPMLEPMPEETSDLELRVARADSLAALDRLERQYKHLRAVAEDQLAAANTGLALVETLRGNSRVILTRALEREAPTLEYDEGGRPTADGVVRVGPGCVARPTADGTAAYQVPGDAPRNDFEAALDAGVNVVAIDAADDDYPMPRRSIDPSRSRPTSDDLAVARMVGEGGGVALIDAECA